MKSVLGLARSPEAHARAAPRPAEDSSAVHYRFGREALAAGRLDAAIASLKSAIESRHDHVDAIVALGEAYAARGAAEDAHDQFQLALAFDSACAGAHVGLARLMRRETRYAEAERHARSALERAPASADAWVELGLTLTRLERMPEAVASYERAVELDPACLEACVNLGLICLTHEGDAVRAESWFRRACDGGSASAAHVNLGLALQEQGRVAEALEVYGAALAKWPDSPDLRWHRATALLLRGDYARGWADYEARKLVSGGAIHRHFPYPEWSGEPLGGGSLLVYAEQGLGDEIMFASCVPGLARRGVHCVLECAPRLASLFARSFPSAAVHGAERDRNRDWLAACPAIRAQSAIGSLPRLLRQSAGEFPPEPGYLAPDAARVAHWRSRLESLGPGIKVGLAWRGGTEKTRRRLRSIAFAQLHPLLEAGGAKFVSLQYAGAQADATEAHPALAAWPEGLADLDETAALIAAVDLVVTVDSTIAHLAGALGRPARVLLAVAPEWRWGQEGDTTPWYPAARLIRQARAGEWDDVIARASAEVQRASGRQ